MPIFQAILSLKVHSSGPMDTGYISEAGNPSVHDIASPNIACSHSPPEVVPCVELPEVLVISSLDLNNYSVILPESKNNSGLFFWLQEGCSWLFHKLIFIWSPLFSPSSQDYLWFYRWLPNLELLWCSVRMLLPDFRAALSTHTQAAAPSVSWHPPLCHLLSIFQKVFETFYLVMKLFPFSHPVMRPFLFFYCFYWLSCFIPLWGFCLELLNQWVHSIILSQSLSICIHTITQSIFRAFCLGAFWVVYDMNKKLGYFTL